MQKRERILAVAAVVTVLVWLGLPRIYDIFLGPVDEARGRLNTVKGQLADKTADATRLNDSEQLLKEWRGRSLPPDPRDAQRLYQVWLTDLAQMCELDELTVTPSRIVRKGDVYTAVLVSISCEARMSQLARFLYHFHRIDLPHRIVGMTIDSSANRGDPGLTVLLTAEGLAFSGVPERKLLFPQARLQEAFRSGSGEQSIRLAEADGFPSEPGFRIRIGSEYLSVTHLAGETWTVQGGIDGTAPGRHDADALVELAPVHPDYRDRSVEDFQKLVEHNPFTKPAPRSAVPVRPLANTNSPPIVRRDNTAAETYLGATVFEDDVPQARLYRRSNYDPTLVRKGSELNVGDVRAVVRDIQAEYVVLEKNDGELWRLELGDNLLSMRRLPRPQTPATADEQQPQDESKKGPDDAPVEAVDPVIPLVTEAETDGASANDEESDAEPPAGE